MKSREEYQASVFAKRDALLAKRRKRISYATAAACIVLCFAAAFIALPQRIEGKIESTTTVQAAEYFQSAETVQADESTAETTKIRPFGGTYPLEAIEEGELVRENASQKNFAFWPSHHTDIDDAYGQRESYVAEAVPEGAGNADSAESKPVSTKKPSSLGKYSNEEIINAAYEYLTDEEKETVNTESAQVTVTRNSQGEETYQIWFWSESKIKVTLNAENLEFIERSEQKADTAATTAAPAYNPMEQ